MWRMVCGRNMGCTRSTRTIGRSTGGRRDRRSWVLSWCPIRRIRETERIENILRDVEPRECWTDGLVEMPVCILDDQNLLDVCGVESNPVRGTVTLDIGELHVIKCRDREVQEVDNGMHIVTPKGFHDGITIAHLHECTEDITECFFAWIIG